MKRLATLLLLIPMTLIAGNLNNPQTLPLYEGSPPNQKASDIKEQIESDGRRHAIRQVAQPTIEVRLPSPGNASGHAVVICPGGGYSGLAYDWEGSDIASQLNGQGIAAIILKYRLPDDRSNLEPRLSPLLDAKRALRIARHNATAWGFSPNKIGIMGFSAGGHLASLLGTQFDEGSENAADPIERLSSKPDFMVLVYPVITFQGPATHHGSRNNLLGKEPSQELLDKYSTHKQVTPATPPTFLVHASDDKSVPVQNSLLFYEACLENQVEVEMHLYPYGGHGFSLGLSQGGRLANWPDRCVDWIKELEL